MYMTLIIVVCRANASASKPTDTQYVLLTPATKVRRSFSHAEDLVDVLCCEIQRAWRANHQPTRHCDQEQPS